MHGMNFAFTEEQEELRKTVRAFLDSKSPETAVRTQMETEQGFDKAVWEQMGSQMGLMGLHIPEEFGGMGFSYVELGVVLEEMGRALVCAPYFATVVLAANTLLQSGDDVAKKKYLPGIAAGETIATLASTEPSGKWDEAGITMAAKGSGAKFTLDGTKMFVIDGHTASLFPGKPSLTDQNLICLADHGTLPPPVKRLTFTYPLINNARNVVVIAAGAKKRPWIAALLAGNNDTSTFPLSGVNPHGKLWIVLDRATWPEA